MTHPLMEIQFRFMDPITPPEIVVRHWYHVPRVGDWVELARVNDDGAVHLRGQVTMVIWSDDMVQVVL